MKLFERNLKSKKKKVNKISISFELLLFAWIHPTQNVGVNNAVIEIFADEVFYSTRSI